MNTLAISLPPPATASHTRLPADPYASDAQTAALLRSGAAYRRDRIQAADMMKNAVIVADNVIKSAKSMPDYLDYVQNDPKFDTVIIRASDEKNDGMAISYKIK